MKLIQCRHLRQINVGIHQVAMLGRDYCLAARALTQWTIKIPCFDKVVWSNEGPVCSEGVGPDPAFHLNSLLISWLNPHNPFWKSHRPNIGQE